MHRQLWWESASDDGAHCFTHRNIFRVEMCHLYVLTSFDFLCKTYLGTNVWADGSVFLSPLQSALTDRLTVCFCFKCIVFYLPFWIIELGVNLREVAGWMCGSGGRGALAISVSLSLLLSQLHTEPRYDYQNNPSIHTECTWLTSPPAPGLATRGNLTGIQPVHSTTFTFKGRISRVLFQE